jgi:hypothetical protein
VNLVLMNLVLIWVQQRDEAEVKRAFQSAFKDEKSEPGSEELADRCFLETVVRLHRTAEGVPCTGLQSAGRDLGPAIPAADEALAEDSSEQVQQLLANALQAGLCGHSDKALAKKSFRSDDLAGGREYVEAYVEYVNYVERTYDASTRPAEGHCREPGESVDGGVHTGHRPQTQR